MTNVMMTRLAACTGRSWERLSCLRPDPARGSAVRAAGATAHPGAERGRQAQHHRVWRPSRRLRHPRRRHGGEVRCPRSPRAIRRRHQRRCRAPDRRRRRAGGAAPRRSAGSRTPHRHRVRRPRQPRRRTAALGQRSRADHPPDSAVECRPRAGAAPERLSPRSSLHRRARPGCRLHGGRAEHRDRHARACARIPCSCTSRTASSARIRSVRTSRLSIDDVIEKKIDMLDAHVSQMYEWLPWVAGNLESVPKGAAERKKWLHEARAGTAERRPSAPRSRSGTVRRRATPCGTPKRSRSASTARVQTRR